MNRSSLSACIRHILRARKGIAGIEFALVAPLFVLVLLATTDVAFYIRMRLRLDTTARTVGQVVTQYNQLYAGDFTEIYNASQLTAGSIAVTGKLGATIVSGITNQGGKASIAWQQISGAGFTSKYGTVGASPVLPASYVPPVGVTLVVVELYSTATPWVYAASLLGGAGTQVVESVYLVQPRLAGLSSITPGTRS